MKNRQSRLDARIKKFEDEQKRPNAPKGHIRPGSLNK